MTTHKRLSASKADRWSRCAGSPLDGDSRPSKFSAEGTAAHALAEQCLRTGCKPTVAEWSADGFSGIFSPSDLAAIDAYICYARREVGLHYYEVQLDLPGERGGTGDAVILQPEVRHIWVLDLKFGLGNIVEAEGNTQLLEYAMGALVKFDLLGYWDTITVGICQPRRDHWPQHTYTRAEVLEHDARMRIAAWETKQPNAKRIPGDWCRFCPIAGSCAERANQYLNMFPMLELSALYLERNK